jgi:CHAT domain-containing protein
VRAERRRTGEGRINTRGEGVAALVRAFHIAGCKDVVATLWSVSDPATAVLTEEFYTNLLTKKGMSKREALRQAQLKVLRHPELVDKRAQELLAQLKKQRIATDQLAWSRDFEDDAVAIVSSRINKHALARMERMTPDISHAEREECGG